MALQHLRASTADKRPTPAAMADGQLAMNTNLASPGLFFKDSNGDLVKVGPVHVGTTAPNATPASGGQAGNSKGEQWLDTSGTNPVFKIWDGSAWQSEAGEFVNASGDTMTGALVMDNQQQVRFRETTANGTNFIALQAPASVASDKTITLPDVTGTVVTTGDTGSVTSTMLLDGTILNADVNASAAIAGTKISPDFGSQNVTTTGTATAASLNPTGSSVPTNGVYLPAANSVAISTNAVERVKFGTAEVVFNDGGANYDFRIEGDTNSSLFFVDASAEAVGIGTTSPGETLSISGNLGIFASTTSTAINSNNGLNTGFVLKYASNLTSVGNNFNQPLAFLTNDTERARIDSSGRLLVGTSSARANYFNGDVTSSLQIEGADGATANIILTRNNAATAAGPNLLLGRSRGSTVGSNTLVSNNDALGRLSFQGNDGTEFVEAAFITAEVDGTPGANDMPGRLVFSTTADGASSPTERMRITNNGRVGIGKTPDVNINTNGFEVGSFTTAGTYCMIARTEDAPLYVNRKGNDGSLISLLQDGVEEGVISVSGTTVTYGGGHLARWSQLPNDEDPSGLLKGTVMSNLDEMCEWGEEDNEQLNKTKISDVEGDPNVAGVFVSTSFSDDGPLDYFCAMTGDMIIRIAEGVTVQRGDLLMSAGDGTAKPQDDDIIRSKTIAKVTSIHVTCTYDDGSYCVPCVLMAC
jgi:ethanolamine utilization microcompartment shell protein EutS